MSKRAVVAAAASNTHSTSSVVMAVGHLLENIEPDLTALVKRGTRVLVKVNMGCSGARDPSLRLTTHPAVVEAIVNYLLDCGAVVSFGDDVARAGKYCDHIYRSTGMSEVAKRTGATLLDFVSVGAREVGSGLVYPRKYLITNAYFDAEIVINAANCRCGPPVVGMSGAIKNMFGCVVGLRKQAIHNIFGADPPRFGRAIADIHRVIPADLSFLDLTSVAEFSGISSVRPVRLLLASADPVALDTVAARAIGYEDLPIWPTYYGGKIGLGCNSMEQIDIRGLGWEAFPKVRLAHPPKQPPAKHALYDRLSRAINCTILRPRPTIEARTCTGCGDCYRRCPVKCIERSLHDVYVIDHHSCVDCGCCMRVCETAAAHAVYFGLAKAVRGMMKAAKRPPEPQGKPARLDSW